MATSKRLIANLAAQLSALIARPLELQMWSPGDGWTRYQLLEPFTDERGRTGASDALYGGRTYRAAEMEIVLRAALSTASALLPEEVQRERMAAFWVKRTAT